MNAAQEHEPNDRAHRRLRAQIQRMFATDELVAVVHQISPILSGQVGMRFLRTVEYGGND